MKLSGKKIALLVTNGFEQSEMTDPRKEMEKEGAKVDLISLSKGAVRGWKDKNWGDEFPVDLALDQVKAQDYDALVLPGGVMNPDTLRTIPQVLDFVKDFARAHKLIAAICHGPWTLINAGLVKGKTVTSWPSLKVDLANAGANWIDKEVVIDDNIITSRKPEDIPAFNKAIIEYLVKK